MSDQPSSKSWSSTAIIYIIILVLVIITVIIIYYVFSLPQSPPFPVSPFDYGDVIEISPAVLTQNNFETKTIQQNQYLTRVVAGPNSNCQHPNDGDAQAGACVPIFTGTQGDLQTKWILRNSWDSEASCTGCNFADPRCPNCPNNLAKQSFTQFGNRFYLQNASASSPGDISALMTYFSFGVTTIEYNPSITFPVTGNTSIPDFDEQRYDSPFIVYFLPTTQQDIYYILFPGNDQLYAPPCCYPNSLSPNDSILSLRPFAQPQKNNYYYPWDANGVPNPNGLLLNSLSESFVSVNGTALGTNKPNIFLFKIKKVGKV
jgi:hypothetical protein